eukprot:CAMPEP_0119357336 /NCGR_PEP_ID=MMETSP1334-20130426/5748_1 /TAXON_ID=127549 /ORGANISM="Calcidiscus leptoporus, Strain RCC1130" /LENGTH=210 /DNA_ID=CAMNT_0007371553 /DNA_START=621 /DNA_END=1250 /DNA_ORIENTATION=+
MHHGAVHLDSRCEASALNALSDGLKVGVSAKKVTRDARRLMCEVVRAELKPWEADLSYAGRLQTEEGRERLPDPKRKLIQVESSEPLGRHVGKHVVVRGYLVAAARLHRPEATIAPIVAWAQVFCRVLVCVWRVRPRVEDHVGRSQRGEAARVLPVGRVVVNNVEGRHALRAVVREPGGVAETLVASDGNDRKRRLIRNNRRRPQCHFCA